jgi:hypothetical protein
MKKLVKQPARPQLVQFLSKTASVVLSCLRAELPIVDLCAEKFLLRTAP